ncbi:hypothetical protein [Geotalea uraniireducens]|nr:hypothetical protein [Geotalea uraniireducens]
MRNFAVLWAKGDGVRTPGDNEVTKAAIVSMVLNAAFEFVLTVSQTVD